MTEDVIIQVLKIFSFVVRGSYFFRQIRTCVVSGDSVDICSLEKTLDSLALVMRTIALSCAKLKIKIRCTTFRDPSNIH